MNSQTRGIRVVHLSTGDLGGGAARAAYRIHDGLSRLGMDSTLAVRNRQSRDSSVRAVLPEREGWHRLWRFWRRHVNRPLFNPPGRPARFATDSYTDDRSDRPGEIYGGPDPTRIIHLHWTAGFVDLPSLLDGHLGRSPIVWTLHDMRAFTGGCHYDYGCGRYRERCGCCPQLDSGKANDASARSLARLCRLKPRFVASGIRIVADSHWLRKAAESSALFSGLAITTVHYGLDLDIFSPGDRNTARKALGLAPDQPAVMFAADGVHIRRKGLDVLLAALGRCRPRPQLLVVGEGAVELPPELTSVVLGPLRQDRLLALAYRAADVFAIPSMEEAFGQTALEAIACGTPVLGSDVGGIPDVVLPGVSGELVREHQPDAWAAALGSLLTRPDTLAAMRVTCRQLAEQRFALLRQARDYSDIYAEITTPQPIQS